MMLPEYAPILLADDNADDRFLLVEACQEAGIRNPLLSVEDGQQVIDCLQGNGPFSDRSKYPRPAMAVLDIKMPRKTGLEALDWIRGSEEWRVLPVLLLTASAYPGDILRAYRLGANAFHVKPTTIQELVELARAIKAYWLRFCEFPKAD